MTKTRINAKLQKLFTIAEQRTTRYGFEHPKTIRAWRRYERMADRLEN